MANDNKISKFRFALIDDTSHQHIFVIRFTRASLLATTICGAIAILLLIFMLIAFTPIRTFIPGYPDSRSKRAAIQNAVKVDSLENVIFRWELYTTNLKRVLTGEEGVQLDSIIKTISQTSVQDLDQAHLRKQDSLLRQHVTEEEQFGIASHNSRKLPIEGVLFFTPVKGVVLRGFDAYTHPFLDIAAAEGTVVKAALDGTVIHAGWDKKTGYAIYIQHEGDLITAYKNNSSITTKEGSRVKAGAPIAVVGASNEESTGSHLHFELWHNGENVDPTQYLNF
ncbi:MAG: M23 family metallopeptidase [Bacteroidales bacterium]|nr:M23 family metallopeptidase [Bacteroidales bacterium]